MFEVTNLANNPLPLSSGPSLVPRASMRLKAVGEKERGYEARGWMRIVEIPKEPAKEPAKEPDKEPSTKTPEEKTK